jgi:transcriptional regulator with XRE-family HTH domain
MDDPLTRALTTAVARSPASRRELCRAAGVEQSLLARVLKGERRATPILAKRLARALRTWSADCRVGADLLTRALTRRR